MISKFKSGVIFATDTESISVVLDKMNTNNIGSIIVVQNEKPVGIFTERDVLKNFKQIGNADFLNKPIATVMTSPIVSITPDKLRDAGQIMIAKKIRHLPVIDPGGAVLGIVSIRDVLQSYITNSLIDAVKPKKKVPKSTAVKAAVQISSHTLHLLTPSVGLEVACKSLLPGNWSIKSWLDPNSLFDEKRFTNAVVTSVSAFFIDLDGLRNHDWRAVLKKFIKLLTQETHPEEFISWSPSMMNESDVDALIKVAASARWSIFQKPLALGALGAEFQKLDKRLGALQ